VDEDKLNHTVRSFLKEVGITSQRTIENAVRDAVRAGRLSGDERIEAKMTLVVDKLGLTHEITADIELK